MAAEKWVRDVLGDGFEAMTFDLGPDDTPLPRHTNAANQANSANPGIAREKDDKDGEGERRTESEGNDQPERLAATLVRSLPRPRTVWQRILRRSRELEQIDVLYVHGWSDYFFQRDQARFWTDRGAKFYALDLRRYGRSLREGQAPGFIGHLNEYDTELELAVRTIRAEQNGAPRRLVLMGHSTGGLVLSLWAARNPAIADALILNSPWLEFQLASRGRQLLAPLVRLGARHNPLDSAPLPDYGFYARAQHTVGPQHELEGINALWRPEQVRQIQSGWLSAVLEGHERVFQGLNLKIPICVMLSARSALPVRWSDDLTRADTVLDVQEVAHAALKLGSSVTVEWIDGALHDVFLSAPEPRHEAYRRLGRWLCAWSATVPPLAR